MNVHIIRDSKVSKEMYEEIFDFLRTFRGPLKFIANEELIEIGDQQGSISKKTYKDKKEFTRIMFSLEMPKEDFNFPLTREELTPQDLINKCKNYRKQRDLGIDEIVILLTEKANSLNWFSYGDENKNIFIHTADWDFYLDCNRSFPIAYEVMSNIFQSLLFKGMEDLMANIHIEESRGCINDFCQDKKDIRLKMKTADICSDCINLVKKRNFPLDIFNQIMDVMEVLRKKLISTERFLSELSAGRVIFQGRNRKMILVDVGNYEVKLTPLEKTVYQFFISKPNGIKANEIDTFRQEIKKLYGLFFKGNNIAQFNNSVDALCNYLDGSMQEKISKINKKLEKTLGNSLSAPYKILKDPSDDLYKIDLNRDLIYFED